jgi:hypothetical protein
MGTKFTYALVLTICSAVMRLLLYFTGFETEKLAVGQHIMWLGLVFMIVILFLGIRAVREESPGQYMSYGKALWTGVIISFFSSLMSAVYNFIHLKFINTQFVDYQMELIKLQWEKAGMSATQMEKAEGFARMMMGPVVQGIVTVIFVVIAGLIISLILAAILKRPAPEGRMVA